MDSQPHHFFSLRRLEEKDLRYSLLFSRRGRAFTCPTGKYFTCLTLSITEQLLPRLTYSKTFYLCSPKLHCYQSKTQRNKEGSQNLSTKNPKTNPFSVYVAVKVVFYFSLGVGKIDVVSCNRNEYCDEGEAMLLQQLEPVGAVAERFFAETQKHVEAAQNLRKVALMTSSSENECSQLISLHEDWQNNMESTRLAKGIKSFMTHSKFIYAWDLHGNRFYVTNMH